MTPNTAARNEGSLFMAMELSNKNWKLAFSNGEKIRHVNVAAGDQKGLRSAIERSKEKLGLATDCPVQKEHLKTPVTPTERKAVKLKKLKGIGQTISWRLSKEMFWRHFDNRRQVGAFSGLTATMYASGNSLVEQGISKAGNRRVRATLIELAWMWTWHQPNSELTKWFMKRFWGGGKRMRRIGIVALARKLLIALWKYVEFDEIPAGAIVRA